MLFFTIYIFINFSLLILQLAIHSTSRSLRLEFHFPGRRKPMNSNSYWNATNPPWEEPEYEPVSPPAAGSNPIPTVAWDNINNSVKPRAHQLNLPSEPPQKRMKTLETPSFQPLSQSAIRIRRREVCRGPAPPPWVLCRRLSSARGSRPGRAPSTTIVALPTVWRSSGGRPPSEAGVRTPPDR